MRSSTDTEHIPLLNLKEGSGDGDACVVVVGTTGTGKTSTVNIYTGAQLTVGEGAQAVTGNTVTVRDNIHAGGPSWIDNPGWSDTEGRSDNLVFKELLRHMQTNRLYKVKAVVWNVMPQCRMDAVLQSQAKFIDMFTVDKDAGRIWSNVVIICKGKLSRNQGEDCQGARMAAKKEYVHADPISLGYEFVEDKVLAGTDDTLRKETLRMLTEEEIRTELEEAFDKLPPCVQVVFANRMCRACGQKGDPRLMEDKCHRSKTSGHIGTLEQRFSKRQIGVAAGVGAVGVVGLITTAALIPTELALIGLPLVMGPPSIMGGHRFMNTASTSPAPCGGIKITDMRWDCCGHQELVPGGCTDLCDLCGKQWGQSDPCVMIRHPDINMQKNMAGYEFHQKDHDLVDVELDNNNSILKV